MTPLYEAIALPTELCWRAKRQHNYTGSPLLFKQEILLKELGTTNKALKIICVLLGCLLDTLMRSSVSTSWVAASVKANIRSPQITQAIITSRAVETWRMRRQSYEAQRLLQESQGFDPKDQQKHPRSSATPRASVLRQGEKASFISTNGVSTS